MPNINVGQRVQIDAGEGHQGKATVIALLPADQVQVAIDGAESEIIIPNDADYITKVYAMPKAAGAVQPAKSPTGIAKRQPAPEPEAAPVKRGPGRPPGSKNKPKVENVEAEHIPASRAVKMAATSVAATSKAVAKPGRKPADHLTVEEVAEVREWLKAMRRYKGE